MSDSFDTRSTFDTGSGKSVIYRLDKLGIGHVDKLPFSIRILLENALRNLDGYLFQEEDVQNLANWDPTNPKRVEVPFRPARVVFQDFTGVPAIVDLAAMRSAMARAGGDPQRINPVIPVDMVIDHSVQVDRFGMAGAIEHNAEMEFLRNRERYEFLHWGQKAFENFKVVPPATGIVHQVNLEFLAKVVQQFPDADGNLVAMPDTLVGADSHTTMINGLGVLGWGVGGIEAEAAMLAQPIYMLMPEVVGFKLTGSLPEGATATDLVLLVTEMLRARGVVSKFVEFYGQGLSSMSLPDRATLANMAPEYGATMGFFPVDDETLSYLRRTGRDDNLITLVERYCKEQGLFRTNDTPDPIFNDTLELDLSIVEPSVAGPMRPQDRIEVRELQPRFHQVLQDPLGPQGFQLSKEQVTQTGIYKDNGNRTEMAHGAVVIAAITSCTNTSNPSVMVAAGLVAKKAAEKGLNRQPYVKTSLAPGSTVVTEYLDKAGLTPYLDQIGFNTVGYGCTTCIGNSGPLPEPVVNAINEGELVVAGVLSGNRNFSGRISPHVRANFLASPPLVVAYALAGTVDIDIYKDPIGQDDAGKDVFLKDIWPSQQEIMDVIQTSLSPEMFKEQYGNVYEGNESWNAIPSTDEAVYSWGESTYVHEPPFFQDMTPDVDPIQPIMGAKVLVKGGDSVTTDHISPAGPIALKSPASTYLQDQDVGPQYFNTYGARRGNHEVMMRGTFANVRLRNLLVPGSEGGVTYYLPTGEEMPIYDAAMKYIDDGTPLIIIGGKDYGMGSSRDWAAKGTLLLGVKAVIVQSYERIHRSNLIMMGVLPLEFQEGESWETLNLTGKETFDFPDLDDDLQTGQLLTVKATDEDGNLKQFKAVTRLDTPIEIEYYRNGGILHTVLRNMLRQNH